MHQKFLLGHVVITTGAKDVLHPEDVQAALTHHAAGDWGDICDDDRRENDLSVVQGLRLLSVYLDRDKTKFWIITEADRSATTILMPNEY